MDDLISRKAVIESLNRIPRIKGIGMELLIAVPDVEEMIAGLPTVDAAPVVHGRWMKGGYACGENEYTCSACGENEWRTDCRRMKYCMFCGAKMDLGETP